MQHLFTDIRSNTISHRYSPDHGWVACLLLNRPATPADFEALARYCCNTPLAPRQFAISTLGPAGRSHMPVIDPWPAYKLSLAEEG